MLKNYTFTYSNPTGSLQRVNLRVLIYQDSTLNNLLADRNTLDNWNDYLVEKDGKFVHPDPNVGYTKVTAGDTLHWSFNPEKSLNEVDIKDFIDLWIQIKISINGGNWETLNETFVLPLVFTNEIADSEIFDIVPNRTTQSSFNTTFNRETISLGMSSPFAVERSRFQPFVFKFTYYCMSESEIHSIVDFWKKHYARVFSFLLPSWQSELTLAVNANENDTEIEVYDNEVDVAVDDVLFFYVTVKSPTCDDPTEQYYFTRNVIAIEDNTITINEGLPVDLAKEFGISKIYRVTFDSDELSVIYETPTVATIELGMVQDIVPVLTEIPDIGRYEPLPYTPYEPYLPENYEPSDIGSRQFQFLGGSFDVATNYDPVGIPTGSDIVNADGVTVTGGSLTCQLFTIANSIWSGGTVNGEIDMANCTINANITLNNGNVGGDIDGTGGIAKIGAGTLRLNVACLYTGDTIVNAGVLLSNINNAIPTTSNLTVSNSIVDLNGFDQTVGTITLDDGMIENVDTLISGNITSSGSSEIAGNVWQQVANRSITVATGDQLEMSIIIDGSVGPYTLSKIGNGTLLLSAINTNGDIDFVAGDIKISQANALDVSTIITMAGGGQSQHLDLNGFNQTFDYITNVGSGPSTGVTSSAGFCDFIIKPVADYGGGDNFKITGNINFVKDGSHFYGFVVNTTSYAGKTIVRGGGTLQLQVANTLSPNAPLELDGSSTLDLNSLGSLNISGVSAVHSFTGTNNIINGTLVLTNHATIIVDSGGTLSIPGDIDGFGVYTNGFTLTQSGSGVHDYLVNTDTLDTPMISLTSGLSATGMAPFTFHANVLATTLPGGTKWRDTKFEWNFEGNLIEGFNAGYTFESAGVYTVELIGTIAGLTYTDHITVTVTANTRTAFYVSNAGDDLNVGDISNPFATHAFAMSQLDDDTEIFFNRGDTFAVTTTVTTTNKSNIRIGAYGSGANPIFSCSFATANEYAISMTNSTDYTVENITFDSTISGFGKINANGVHPSGYNIAIRNCVFNNVTNAVSNNNGAIGLMVDSNSAPLSDGLRGYFTWMQGTDLVIINNDCANSTRESCVRGDADRICIAFNDFSNIDNGGTDAGDDAKQTIRPEVCDFVYISENTVSYGSMVLGPLCLVVAGVPDVLHPETDRLDNWIVKSNKVIETFIRLRHGAQNGTLFNNAGNTTTNSGEFIQVQGQCTEYSGRGVDDVIIDGNAHYTTSTNGYLLKIVSPNEGGATGNTVAVGLVLKNNIIIGASLTSGSYGVHIASDTTLNSFTDVLENIWSINNLGFYLNGAVNDAAWQALSPVASRDRMGTVTFSTDYQATLSGVTAGSTLSFP